MKTLYVLFSALLFSLAIYAYQVLVNNIAFNFSFLMTVVLAVSVIFQYNKVVQTSIKEQDC